jgi:pyruvate/2-oxoglutarate dehydrogenase complex dihydrolipoamide dehydrogenase (E3) component
MSEMPPDPDSSQGASRRAGPVVEPMDVHNRELIANVHPPDWVNPEPADRYHLVVVGAGTAGLVSASIAAGLGARVALVERHLMGGDCLNVGCVPSKAMIAAARAWHDAGRAREVFAGPAVAEQGGDFAAVMERMRRLRASLSPIDGAARFRDLGVDVFLGQGRFVASDALEVGGRRLRFRNAVLAIGARAKAPPIPGLDRIDYLTNESVFSLTELPPRLGVIGAGPMGCELSQAVARLGGEVHLFNLSGHVLPREDADAAAIVERSMAADGVAFHQGVEIVEVAARDAGVAVVTRRDGQRRETAVDRLLVAVGRSPNVEGLGLEAAGVEYDRVGVEVDDRLRTTNFRIFAAGDVASRHQFTHSADFQARMVIRNAFFFGRGKASKMVIPWTTYTSPEVAHVGLYAAEAEKLGYAVDTLTVPLSEVDRAVLDGEDEGFLRVHLKKGGDRILGGTLVAERAGDMIGLLSLAMTHGLGLAKLSQTIFPYPTRGEVFRKAGDLYNRGRLTERAKRFFALWFRIFG